MIDIFARKILRNECTDEISVYALVQIDNRLYFASEPLSEETWRGADRDQDALLGAVEAAYRRAEMACFLSIDNKHFKQLEGQLW